MKKKKKGHTGNIRHSDMTSLLDGMGSKDPHASSEHHAANKSCGMPNGLQNQGDESGCDGAEGLEGGNSEYGE